MKANIRRESLNGLKTIKPQLTPEQHGAGAGGGSADSRSIKNLHLTFDFPTTQLQIAYC